MEECSRGVFVALVVALAGCAVGPDYERPRVEEPATMPGLPAAVSSEGLAVVAGEPPAEWWRLFRDPQLEALIREARVGNQGLRAAVARVHAARAAAREAFAPLLPTIGATGQYSYLRFAPNALPFNAQTGSIVLPGTPPATPQGSAAQAAPTTFAFTGTPFQVWAGTADMTYELDLWGRVRRAVEQAQAQEAATEEDTRNVEITLAADVAEAYFDVGEAEADVAIAREAVATRERSLALTQERFELGLAPELDARRARSELSRARARVPEAERRGASASHRLAVLLGRYPTLRFEGRAPASFDLPPQVPVGLPATLLERRPDIRAAEQRLRSANARIGEAIAGFFPRVTIFGRFGYASLDLERIAQGGSQLYAAGPAIHLPIFEGGRTYFRMLAAEASTDEAAASYYATVLTAFREVADAIVALGAHREVRDHERLAVDEAARALALATERYERGLTNYLSVLDAQRSHLDARLSLLRAQRRLLSDLVQLEKALGGGWTTVPETERE